jgi:GT2 family glycosyltransferase
MRAVAVVVNWNGGEDNLLCLRSLLDQGLREEDVVFVDNGSSDGSPDRVAQLHPGVTVLCNETNQGFARGSNQGMERALATGAELLFLVNNDVELPPRTLDTLVAALEAEPRLGIVGPRIVYRSDPRRIWSAGCSVEYRQNLTTLRGHGALDGPEWQDTREVDFVAGCAMLVRREVVERVGMFDEALFAYHEDADLGLRARAAGFGVACVGAVAARHDPHSSTGGGYNARRKYMLGVNSIWFLRKHGTPRSWLRFVVFDVLTLPLLLFDALFMDRVKPVLAKGLGILDGLRGRRVTADTVREGRHRLW